MSYDFKSLGRQTLERWVIAAEIWRHKNSMVPYKCIMLLLGTNLRRNEKKCMEIFFVEMLMEARVGSSLTVCQLGRDGWTCMPITGPVGMWSIRCLNASHHKGVLQFLKSFVFFLILNFKSLKVLVSLLRKWKC